METTVHLAPAARIASALLTGWLLGSAPPAAAAFDVAGPAQANVDTNPATSVFLNVPDTGPIADINLAINISTAWADDIDLFLIHNAVTVHVYDGIGDTFTSFIDATFDDEAGVAYPANGTVTGVVLPSPGALSAFDGVELSGLWELQLLDTIVPGDGNSLVSWRLFGSTIVPEPNTGMLVGLSLGGLAVWRRRRNHWSRRAD